MSINYGINTLFEAKDLDTYGNGLKPVDSGTGISVTQSNFLGGVTLKNFLNTTGFDLVWQQQILQKQMVGVMNDIYQIQANTNLSDTEKMFSIQMAMNTWSSIANLRTNMLKSVSDTLKSIGRNVA